MLGPKLIFCVFRHKCRHVCRPPQGGGLSPLGPAVPVLVVIRHRWAEQTKLVSIFFFPLLTLSCRHAPERHQQLQRAVWAPHSDQTEAVHPEPGHQAADPRERRRGHHGAEGRLPVPGAPGQPCGGHTQACVCLQHGQWERKRCIFTQRKVCVVKILFVGKRLFLIGNKKQLRYP